jgi:hypothetical protein
MCLSDLNQKKLSQHVWLFTCLSVFYVLASWVYGADPAHRPAAKFGNGTDGLPTWEMAATYTFTNTYYVDTNNPSAADDDSHGSEALPFKTISYAARQGGGG